MTNASHPEMLSHHKEMPPLISPERLIALFRGKNNSCTSLKRRDRTAEKPLWCCDGNFTALTLNPCMICVYPPFFAIFLQTNLVCIICLFYLVHLLYLLFVTAMFFAPCFLEIACKGSRVTFCQAVCQKYSMMPGQRPVYKHTALKDTDQPDTDCFVSKILMLIE